MSFQDCFSKQAASYRQFRPTYPDALFDFLAEKAPGRTHAWDCATGNGQAALALAKRFETVTATDAAEAQILEATPASGVTYSVQPAEKTSIVSGSCDLITVAQAVHWFDLDRFYAEVRRVSKPQGVLALWGYGYFETESPLEELFDEYGEGTLRTYWPEKTRILQRGYEDLPFPFEAIPAPKFSVSADWDLARLRGYLDSWSATQAYKDGHGKDPYSLVAAEIEKAWGDPKRRVRFTWDLFLKVGGVG